MKNDLILLEFYLVTLWARQKNYPRDAEATAAVATLDTIFCPTHISKQAQRRHGKKIKLAAEILGCSRRSIYNILTKKGVTALAARIECAGRPDIAASFREEAL